MMAWAKFRYTIQLFCCTYVTDVLLCLIVISNCYSYSRVFACAESSKPMLLVQATPTAFRHVRTSLFTVRTVRLMSLSLAASVAVLMSCQMQLHSANETQMLDLTQSPSRASLAKLKALLENGNIVKVFHDCQQDAEQLYRHHAIKVQNIFDTRVREHLAELCPTATSDRSIQSDCITAGTDCMQWLFQSCSGRTELQVYRPQAVCA